MQSRLWLLKIAVFFIPGLLFLIYICFVFSAVKGIVSPLWKEPEISRLVFIVVICFIVGCLIDFLRAMVTALLQWIGSFIKRSDNSSKLRIFDSLTSHTYRYRHLGFNISLSIFVVWGLSLLKKLDSTSWISISSFEAATIIAAFVLGLLTWVISHWNACRTISTLKAAFEQNQKCEGDKSCLKKCHPKDQQSTC